MTKKARVLVLASVAVVVGLAAAGTGCIRLRSQPWRYTVRVTISQAMADSVGNLPSVEVHVLALDTVRGMSFQRAKMGEYWNPNRKADDYYKYVMRFGGDSPTTQALAIDDPIWGQWLNGGATHLFVLADLTGVFADEDDVQDPRRLILPLDPARWGRKEIQVMLEPDGVFCLTPRRPRAQ